MSDTPELQEYFGQPGGQQPGCGFPVAHVMALFHAGTGMVFKMLSASLRTHDLSQAVKLHPALRAGDVLVGDRGFCSYAHFALLAQHDVHAVFRMHQKQLVDFTPGRAHVERARLWLSCGPRDGALSRWHRDGLQDAQCVLADP